MKPAIKTFLWLALFMLSQVTIANPVLVRYINELQIDSTAWYLEFMDDYIELNIYDVSGRLVERIYRGLQPAGQHKIKWQPGLWLPVCTYLSCAPPITSSRKNVYC